LEELGTLGFEKFIQNEYRARHGKASFTPGETAIPVTGKVFGTEELSAAVQASLDFWLTSGPYTEEFESRFAKTVGMRHAFMVNSGSSANLLALSSLTSPAHGERALKPGDEVVTVAAGFPTTVTPILQNALVPVYVDVDPETYARAPFNVRVQAGRLIELKSAVRKLAPADSGTPCHPNNVAIVVPKTEPHQRWIMKTHEFN
jgi:CDP-6-deoxy-D-xylo-4-hexulose-3-dehydrase